MSNVLYYYGDNVPNFVQYKGADPAKVLPGYDHDAIDEWALEHRARAGALRPAGISDDGPHGRRGGAGIAGPMAAGRSRKGHGTGSAPREVAYNGRGRGFTDGF